MTLRRGIFQGDSLSPLLFAFSMVPLNVVLRRIKVGYKFISNKEESNYLMFMDDIKLVTKDEKERSTMI